MAERKDLPVIPLREAVVFPRSTSPFNVGRQRSMRLIEAISAEESQPMLGLFTQRNAAQEDPLATELHGIGTLAQILHTARTRRDQPGYLVLAAGLRRVRMLEAVQRDPFLIIRVELLDEIVPGEEDAEYLALRDSVRQLFTSYVQKSPNLSNDMITAVVDIEDAAALSDLVAAVLPALTTTMKQQLLEELDVRQRMRRLVEELVKENEKLDLEQKIQSDIRERVAGAQREFLLREQLKTIQRELGESDEGDTGGLEELRRKLDQAGLPEEVRSEAARELDRLNQIPAASPEHGVARDHLEWLAALPWARTSAEEIDLPFAERVLDEDHYDLEKVKQRIIEYLAVLRLRRELRGPILCFVGPPGVGKTSLGRSIARALGRRFVRISLGGMHDEAELRGHRRTYVGAMPGQIIQGLRRAGTRDPVFMLDEVDKLGRDFRGDPAAALLEVLDPEQNFTFRDHYIDAPFDLSRVMFIGTANVLDPVPPPLLDRMEIMDLSGYSEEEKLHIARRYLVPKQVRENGLVSDHVHFEDDALTEMARFYTREAGVRSLEREIGSVCRKLARRVAEGSQERYRVDRTTVRELLGPERFHVDTEIERRTISPGVVVGLAWTPQGGDILFVEATRITGGRGTLTLTGQLGDVMQESARAAFTWLRAHAGAFGVSAAEVGGSDVHIHVPAGAVPKDGPSAGVAIAAALASAFTGRPSRADVAMTGEITLSGHVLPVGGIREKVLAARRSGIKHVILPVMNEVNVIQDIPAELRVDVELIYVATVEQAVSHALVAPTWPATADLGPQPAAPP